MIDTNLLESIRNKFSRYSEAECNYAKLDCIETLAYHTQDAAYTAKLWAEIDAANERLAKLSRSQPCAHCKGTGRIPH